MYFQHGRVLIDTPDSGNKIYISCKIFVFQLKHSRDKL